jgi:NitT/TauT family transport system ATP-binding protein
VAVRIDHVTKVFSSGGGSVTALEDISLSVGRGEFVCLLGASGCGKSTLLNLVAELDQPTGGTVEREGDPSFMFQEAALFPWLNVERNVELPLRLRKVPKAERQRRVAELLEMVQLSAFAKRQPHELSGGMRQRVSLARALAQDAEVLLMDEPFGALDAMTRDILHDELERIWQATGRTILFVTHNVREAVRLGDRVVLLTSRPGRVAEEFQVEMPRPRRIEDRNVAELAGEITTRLRQEVARHGR